MPIIIESLSVHLDDWKPQRIIVNPMKDGIYRITVFVSESNKITFLGEFKKGKFQRLYNQE